MDITAYLGRARRGNQTQLHEACSDTGQKESLPERGRLAVACIVYPNLSDAELQNSYHVKCAEDLLKTMLTPGEYVDCVAKVQEICGFDTLLDDEVEAAKNS